MKNNKKCIVLFSGGLDSRLALKIIQEQIGEKNVIALFFKLPFGTGCCDEIQGFNFTQKNNIKLEIIDCTKGRKLKDYLEILKKPKYGVGKGVNPCNDCRIFILKLAKKYAKKNNIEIIATGEVLGERPMSQMLKSLKLVEKESRLKNKILRPLSAKLLPETEYEKKGIINRKKLYGIQGRQRKEQIRLTKKFNINYPHPAGGCLLCEKVFKKRFQILLRENLINKKTQKLINIGRHFYFPDLKSWVIVGRNERENTFMESNFSNIIKSGKRKPAVYFNKKNSKNIAKKLQKAYELKKPQMFKEYKI
ncbi:MAG: hypothetical protein ACOCUU_02605 [Nanoarchaeota archaeon]